MSGGQWDYSQHVIRDIGNDAELKSCNSTLADILVDLHKVLNAYDRYLCADTGRESAERTWRWFCNKWKDAIAQECTENEWQLCPFCKGAPNIFTREDKWFRYVCKCTDCGAELESQDKADLKIKWNTAKR